MSAMERTVQAKSEKNAGLERVMNGEAECDDLKGRRRFDMVVEGRAMCSKHVGGLSGGVQNVGVVVVSRPSALAGAYFHFRSTSPTYHSSRLQILQISTVWHKLSSTQT